jgi:hypothetical protein
MFVLCCLFCVVYFVLLFCGVCFVLLLVVATLWFLLLLFLFVATAADVLVFVAGSTLFVFPVFHIILLLL